MQSSIAMDFARVGDVVMASGEIAHGDSDRFMNFIKQNNMIATDDCGGSGFLDSGIS
jgi:hypothetical protein